MQFLSGNQPWQWKITHQKTLVGFSIAMFGYWMIQQKYHEISPLDSLGT